MATTPKLSFRIEIDLIGKKLKLTEQKGTANNTLLDAEIVSGCEDTGTPVGTYVAGSWIKDKTNPIHGPTAWSKNMWANPYGPYFLPLNDSKTGKYTTYGIHGTRGPIFGGHVTPPLPKMIVSAVLGHEETKYLYCSHGCIRVSNQSITKIRELTAGKNGGASIIVQIK